MEKMIEKSYSTNVELYESLKELSICRSCDIFLSRPDYQKKKITFKWDRKGLHRNKLR